MSQSFVELGSIAKFINGAAFKPEDWGESGLRIIRIQNLTDLNKPFNRTERIVSDSMKVQHGDLLVSWSATLGVYEWNDSNEALLNQHIFRVLPDELKVDKRYLRHGLEGAIIDMQQHLHGATMQHVNRGEFLKTKLHLPPIDQQKRIAAILDKAEELRRLRRQSIEHLDVLSRSIFIKMFGDPEAHDWKINTIGDILKPGKCSIRTGPFGSQLLHSEFVDEGVAVLGIDNAVSNEFRWNERRFISNSKYQQLKRYTVNPGDVIITIMGTCGRCAVVPNDIPLAINTKHLCCITLDQNKCSSKFLQAYFLMHPIANQYLNQTMKGAIMAGLNMNIIKAMPIPIPPLSLQQEFAQRIETIESLKAKHSQSLTHLDILFASLQHRAFRGEL